VIDAAGWWRAHSTHPVVNVDAVKRRLELLLASVYETQFEISSTSARHVVSTGDDTLPRIKLPAKVDASDGAQAAVALYRLLALEQAARFVRASAKVLTRDEDFITRDLFNLRESAEIDAGIARSFPGVAALLHEQRVNSLKLRATREKLSPQEIEVERLMTTVLSSDPTDVTVGAPAGASPAESLAWARATAASLLQLGGKYRSRPKVRLWVDPTGQLTGEVRGDNRSAGSTPGGDSDGSGETAPARDDDEHSFQEASATGKNALDVPPDDYESDSEDSAAAADGAQLSYGNQDEQSGEAAEPTSGAGILNDVDTGILVASRARRGVLYPEWDCNLDSYRELGAVVHASVADEGDPSWASRVLGEQPALVRRIQKEFERLRARRVRMLRQREGDELDLAACVRAFADASVGDSSDDRLYLSVRPARRAMAIAVLVDVSGSTADPVADGRRVIDVEKITLLLAGEAFDALGDSYAILTFSSNGAADVRVSTVKSFTEANGDAVRRRIAGLHAGGRTRLGAAIRHSTAVLSAQPAGNRLLLILSDGKPNDVDRYFTTYATEDSRRAIQEARAEGVFPYCITIDANDPDPYLERVFGSSGHTILRRAEQLPAALLGVVRQLLRGGGA
jgi:nitric oxide reductase NorD protein